MTTQELITEITKSLIALIVVIGTGYAIITSNANVALVSGTLGVVIGYYFNRVSNPPPAAKG